MQYLRSIPFVSTKIPFATPFVSMRSENCSIYYAIVYIKQWKQQKLVKIRIFPYASVSLSEDERSLQWEESII